MDATAWPLRDPPALPAGSDCDMSEGEGAVEVDDEVVLASGTLARVPSIQQPQHLSTPPTTPSLETRLAQLLQSVDVVVEIESGSDIVAGLRAQRPQATSEQAALAALGASDEWALSAGRLRYAARCWAAMVARDSVTVAGERVALVARIAGMESPAALARWLAARGLRLRQDGCVWRVEGDASEPLDGVAAMAAAVPQVVAALPAAEDGEAEADIAAEVEAAAMDVDRLPARASRRARRVTNYDEQALADAAAAGAGADEAPAKRARRSAPSAAPESRPESAARAARGDVSSSAGMRLALERAGAAVCVAGDRAPGLAQLLAPDMPPLLVPRSAALPAHVVARRAASSESQPLADSLADDFPLPVVLARWQARQQQRYAAYVAEGLCRSVSVQAAARNATCQRFRSSLPSCKHCVSRQADQPCLFRDVAMVCTLAVTRFDGAVAERVLAAPILAEPPAAAYDGFYDVAQHQARSQRRLLRAAAGAADGPAWQAAYCALAVAPLLAPLLARAVELLEPTVHVRGAEYTALPGVGCSSAPCVRRPLADGSRELCDACAGEVFGVYFLCSLCARELCAGCFARLDDAPVRARRASAKSPPRLLLCRTVARAGARVRLAHRRDQFVRVSRLAPASVARALGCARAGLEAARLLGPLDCLGRVAPADAAQFAARVGALQARARARHAYAAWEAAPVCVEAGELTLGEFSRLWRAGTVVVVRGLLARLDAGVWQPAWWARHRGHEPVTILDCARGAAAIPAAPDRQPWTIADFFRWFDQDVDSDDDAAAAEPSRARELRRHVRSGILKLKDYPPTEDFAAKLPKHFARFMRALPFPEYTHRAGALNLASRLPQACLPPDLGPKMYCAYGSSDAQGGYGTTNLHCDMADAVNLMCYAAGNRPDQPAAVWDLFPAECMPALREYMKAEMPPPPPPPPSSSAPATRPEDPVHDQGTYVTAEHRAAFCARNPGTRIFRVYQNPGDAVFVPAGFAHQVCNYANAVKVAVDFVSPERVHHCDRLASEFRALSSNHPRGRDKLQLDNMMFWTLAADPDSGIVPPGELGGGGDGGDGGGSDGGDSADGSDGNSNSAKDKGSSAGSRARAERRDRRESRQATAATPKQPRRYVRKGGSKSPDDAPSSPDRAVGH
ncbi:hypothetical protein LPJ53_000845 [Coemansia erecta]|uniref:JmjC domain-containing protein n=1 Tax=Coemansia erecta TaxID=147472 RepID=A0A9W7Y152_9FUNG|nr:hypothetical protein LPJ53_000845 [Coemansia erecta]